MSNSNAYFGHMKKSLFVLLSILMYSCSGIEKESTDISTSYENGLYLILDEFPEKEDVTDWKNTVEFSLDFLEGNREGQPLYLQLDTSDFVPLDLAVEPHGITQPDKRINLMITLTEAAGEKLAEFTEDHIMDRVAIVIGGKAVTKHKVRSKIDSGKLQITRCTDNACEHLLVELKKKS